jgi:hypothetical protein
MTGMFSYTTLGDLLLKGREGQQEDERKPAKNELGLSLRACFSY